LGIYSVFDAGEVAEQQVADVCAGDGEAEELGVLFEELGDGGTVGGGLLKTIVDEIDKRRVPGTLLGELGRGRVDDRDDDLPSHR
jgi:hypothetical protein